ncbi:MAG: polyphosphate:AMP phosphotransferase [Gammaproteobacteria bacterium]
MFRTAELGRTVSKSDYKERALELRQELLEAQQALRECRCFPVILVFAGVDGAGKGETVNLLNAWMDPRWLVTRAYGEPADVERERPEYWRFWRDLPPKGQVGMFLSAWYSKPVLDMAYGRIDLPNFDERLDRIIAFENALADDRAVILKFWMHLSRIAQKRRLKAMEKDPLLRWRVTEVDWQHWRMYDRFIEAAERTIMRTSTAKGPWFIVEGADERYRSLAVGTIIRDGIRKRLEEVRLEADHRANRASTVSDNPGTPTVIQGTATVLGNTGSPLRTVLSALDMAKSLDKTAYPLQLKRYQAKLNLLHRTALQAGTSTIVVFEGPDAAGKGGAIRRLTEALDARNYQVIPTAAPTDEERAQHYLWRFWRHLSRAGRFTIFDRSWYGRVLVERVEGFASEAELGRAYGEINDFEAQLIEHGIVLLKYWLHITKDEQHQRFKAREETPHKQWKLTDEDWRNREKWDAYEIAVNDMVEHTSTSLSPWILVEGNDKRFARIKVFKTLCAKLEEKLKAK